VLKLFQIFGAELGNSNMDQPPTNYLKNGFMVDPAGDEFVRLGATLDLDTDAVGPNLHRLQDQCHFVLVNAIETPVGHELGLYYSRLATKSHTSAQPFHSLEWVFIKYHFVATAQSLM